MNREQRQSLINQLWERDEPHIMIVKYDETRRIGTRTSTITCHTNPIQAIDAFFCLLGNRQHHHPALNDNLYRWLLAHSDPEEPCARDLVVNVMSDLKEDLAVYRQIVFLEIIPLLEFHTRDHGTLAWRLETTTNLPLTPMSEYTYGLRNNQATPDPASESPEPQLSEDVMNTGLIDREDVVMFDFPIPPAGLPSIVLGEYALLDDEVEVQLLPSQTELSATPTPSFAPLFAADLAPAPLPVVNSISRVHDVRLGLDVRRVFDCIFQGCPSRFTRPSDLARHWRNLHPNYRQQ
jgi:hypothetical protein